MSQHLLFYDGECGLCDHIVQFVLKIDTHQQFLFAPLQGETAKKWLADLPEQVKNADSLILIENFQTPKPKIWIYGKGALTVFWLIGGWWRLIGLIAFLPAFLYDWGYWLIAKNRHRLFSRDSCLLPDPKQKKRFLP